MRTRMYGIAVLTCLIAPTPGVAWSETRQATSFTITSTLTGRTALPHRIHWLARPRGASSVVEVDFLIDGRTAWVEREAPYTYGDDGNWLVTSALSPGRHRFTVRAKAADGTTAQRTTIARVLPAVPPPSELDGASWQRVVTQEQAGEGTPGGTWVISVDKTGWSIRDPQGSTNWIDAAYRSDNLIQLRGGIWMHPVDTPGKRGGNGWCQDTNYPVDYSWAVSADTLTIGHDGADDCGLASAKQDRIVAGVWTRVA